MTGTHERVITTVVIDDRRHDPHPLADRAARAEAGAGERVPAGDTGGQC